MPETIPFKKEDEFIEGAIVDIEDSKETKAFKLPEDSDKIKTQEFKLQKDIVADTLSEQESEERDFINVVNKAEIPVLVESDKETAKVFTEFDFRNLFEKIGIPRTEDIRGDEEKGNEAKEKVIKAFKIIENKLFEGKPVNIRFREMLEYDYLSFIIYDVLNEAVKKRGVGLEFVIEEEDEEEQKNEISQKEKEIFKKSFEASLLNRENNLLRFDLEKILLSFNIPHDKDLLEVSDEEKKQLKQELKKIFEIGMIEILEKEKDNNIIMSLEDHEYLRSKIYKFFSEHKKEKLMLVVEKFLGEGGLGEVRKGSFMEKGFDRPVAVKLGAEHVATNMDKIIEINDKNVSRIESAIPMGDNKLLQVMEYVEGSAFNIERLELSEALESIIQVIEGTSAFHEKGLAHFDIKPENIIVGKEKTKIIDCEMAQNWDNIKEKVKNRQIMGTPNFISPEAFFSSQIFENKLRNRLNGIINDNKDVNSIIEKLRKEEDKGLQNDDFRGALVKRMNRHLYEGGRQLMRQFGATHDNVDKFVSEYMKGFIIVPEKQENETEDEIEKREELEKDQLERIDIFSIGRMLEEYFFTTDDPENNILDDKLEKIELEKRLDAREVLKELVKKMTSVRPIDRPSKEEAIKDLKNILKMIK